MGGKNAKEYCKKVEGELDDICTKILELLDKNLINKASTGESKVFYQKMKADYYRYQAEFKDDGDKTSAAENAKLAYEEAQKVAEKDLAVAHPIRLGLALNFSVFQYEVLQKPEEACKMARSASRMQLQNSIMWQKIPTKIPLSSCSYSATT